jgi:glycosyltransferase involved in cell wall biosynthesis
VFDSEIVKNILLYVPISIIGAWRWSYWLIRRLGASLYRPKIRTWPEGRKKPTVTIVTPVYNEDPAVFEEAMQSWINNGVDEIIAVIDKTNTRHIVQFDRNYVNNTKINTKCRMLVTPKPGKRAALCDGIEKAKGDLIAVVDSDTVWSPDVLAKTLPYFLDPSVGGATVAQRISNPNTTGNVMFDILLWTRYRDEVPFLLGVGRAFNTLSGRTAFYRREAIFNDKYDNMHLLRHEFFMGTRGISGDDKRLTHLVLEQGWHTAFVLDTEVSTPGLGSLKTFLKQRLRWTRNSWRADLRAVARGWVFKHPALAIFMIDRFVQPIFMLIGPIVLTISIIHEEWLFVGILITWWFVSRFIRLFGYFKAYPKRLIYLPAFIVYGYVNALIKIYALATLIEHSWATRWHKTRMKRKGLLKKSIPIVSGALGILVFTFAMTKVVLSVRSETGVDVPTPVAVNIEDIQAQTDLIGTKQLDPPMPGTINEPTKVGRYVIQPGDTMEVLSARFEMSVTDLKRLNNIRDADKVAAGQEIIYYKGTIR